MNIISINNSSKYITLNASAQEEFKTNTLKDSNKIYLTFAYDGSQVFLTTCKEGNQVLPVGVTGRVKDKEFCANISSALGKTGDYDIVLEKPIAMEDGRVFYPVKTKEQEDDVKWNVYDTWGLTEKGVGYKENPVISRRNKRNSIGSLEEAISKILIEIKEI